jgi:hypothetical protein
MKGVNDSLDTLPDPEFMAIFRRNAVYLNMKGITSEQELDALMKDMQFKMMERAKENKRQKKKWWRKARLIMRLRMHGFPRRVIDEAIADPYSIYALSLKYGYARAVKIKLAEARKRIRRRRRRR